MQRNARPSLSLALAVGFALAPSCGRSGIDRALSSEPGTLAGKDGETRLKVVDSEIALSGSDSRPTLVEDKLALTFKYIAQMQPPSIGGAPLQATQFASKGEEVFIVYNQAGEQFGGALDIVDLSDVSRPKHRSSLVFKDTEFASIAVEGEYAFLVGARDLDRPGAILVSVRISNPDKPEVLGSLELAGYYATAVQMHGRELKIAVGDGTGIVLIDVSDPANPELKETLKLEHATDLLKSGSKTYALGGISGAFYSIAEEGVSGFVKLAGSPFESPARAVADRGNLFTNAVVSADGKSVLHVVDEDKASIVAEVPLEGRGNGIDVHGRYLFLAQGDAGAQVFDVRRPEEPGYLGAFDFKGDSGSANQIRFGELSSKDVVLLGDGSGGLRIVSMDSSTQFSARIENGVSLGEARSLRGPVQFSIPHDLQVVEGNAGNGIAVFRFDSIECVYAGGSPVASPKPGSPEWKRGLQYRFVKCSGGEHPQQGIFARREVEFLLKAAHPDVPVTRVQVRVKSF